MKSTKKKLPKLTTLRNKLDAMVSRYVRASSADDSGYARCVTCDKQELWQDMDAGHFLPRGSLATRWDLRNVHSQCRFCNRFRVDAYIDYTIYMQLVYGVGVVNELRALKYTVKKLNRAYLEGKLTHFTVQLSKLGLA